MKEYTIRSTRYRFGYGKSSTNEIKGTIQELIKYFKYTLEVGQSWEREKGNYKINTNPKTGKALVSALNKAEHNRAANGIATASYELAG